MVLGGGYKVMISYTKMEQDMKANVSEGDVVGGRVIILRNKCSAIFHL